ncbi:hypothetical protein P5634_13735 [Bacillus subtilis]|nr:hypothetical protein P5634_13735 [Bacillus subtilis]
MSKFEKGAAALNALNSTNEGGSSNTTEFTSFTSGTSFKVRVLGTEDLIRFYSYGIYKKVNSFVAQNPSDINDKGFPEGNFTPWDLAWKYYQDLKREAADKGDSQAEEKYKEEASKYRVKERYALGFIDLATGEPIIIDLSKKQAKTVYAVILKYEKKLGKVAFELEKTGSGTSTTVSLTPVIDMDDDLTDKERENFAKYADKQFDMKLFDGLLFEADEKTQLENLVAAGFDISLIGKSLGGNAADEHEPWKPSDEDLPF